MEQIKHIIVGTLWTLLGLYVMLLAAVRVPAVQQKLGESVADVASKKLGTQVRVGRVDLGFLNRIIVDDMIIYDQRQREMLKAARLTAKLELMPLASGKIAISSAQIFGVKASFYKLDDETPANFQFLIDSLSSNDTASHSPFNLKINSFIMRRSSFAYDRLDVAKTLGKLNPAHLQFNDVSAHVILKTLTDDSLNVNVKRLAFNEQSGLNVRRLAFQMVAGPSAAVLRDLRLLLPSTALHVDSVCATFNRQRLEESISYQAYIGQSRISPSDLSCLIPQFKHYRHNLNLTATASGTAREVSVNHLDVLSDGGDLQLRAKGGLSRPLSGPATWHAEIANLQVGSALMEFVSEHLVNLPDPLLAAGDISLSGEFHGSTANDVAVNAEIQTALGNVAADLHLDARRYFGGHLATEELNLGRLIDNAKAGKIATELTFAGELSGNRLVALETTGTIPAVDYDGHTYNNISFNEIYRDEALKGWLHVDDDRLKGRLEADVSGRSLSDVEGIVSLLNLEIPEKDFNVSYVRLESQKDGDQREVRLNSDFAHVELKGALDYRTLTQSVANIVGSRLPSLPGLPPLTADRRNHFTLQATVADASWLEKLAGVSLILDAPLTLQAIVNDRTNQLQLEADMPRFSYQGGRYETAHLSVSTPTDSMLVFLNARKINDNGNPLALTVAARAADNHFTTNIGWDNHNTQLPISGQLNAVGQLYTTPAGDTSAHVAIQPSAVSIGGEDWRVEASDLNYSADRLDVDHFVVEKGTQYFKVNGCVSKQSSDSLTVELNDVEVAYILDLINFDAVDFAGQVTGRATLASAFQQPSLHADLGVTDFKFQHGRMGHLSAAVDWNKQLKQIDIHATANDGLDAMTFINGYVSPERNYIDFDIRGQGTHIDFLHSFTDAFLDSIGGHTYGSVRLHGPLSEMQLNGHLTVDGQATVKPLGTTYTLRKANVEFVDNDILLQDIPVYDRYDNVGILSGGIHHRHLTNMTFDLGVKTDLLLAYDEQDFGEGTFYGTVFASGDVTLEGRPGRVTIDCDVTPLRNTVFTYNASSPDAISNQEFITWRDTGELSHDSTTDAADTPPATAGSDLHMNLNINMSPDATMRLLMDAASGDYITLNGNGVLRATYYNKGAFQMFGTYTVDHGTYGITIQNIINKTFNFNPGGTIVFGGDPYDAELQLQAVYPVQGVSLSDLSIGNSFSANTIRVNCLMNISGQPNQPRVEFDLDMPTVNADEQQMVRSVINGEQEMNQQVLYLLTIGRFYQQGQNNQQSSQGQTTLAMQSLLSGTLSSQLNNVLSSVIKNDDWNFGANISTGTEGWNNAEYEGVINGRMLNNRLLINGQFGYRDNATQATPSFIGDFDIRYLLFPNGNLALKVYNQTNDRYFTRSSLNTQGIGIILKKDFGRIDELFRKR